MCEGERECVCEGEGVCVRERERQGKRTEITVQSVKSSNDEVTNKS